MKITKQLLRQIIKEEMASTKKYDEDPALTGDQDELPDDLQAAIIDKADGKDKKKGKAANEVRRLIYQVLFETDATPATHPEMTEDDLIDAIRDYSKELTGKRSTYGDWEDLEALTMIELQDYYEAMFDSPEATEYRKQREMEDQKFADSQVGYDEEVHPLEHTPSRQGMRHRQETIQRLNKIIKEELKKELKSRKG